MHIPRKVLRRCWIPWLALAPLAAAQTPAELKPILERLDRLEAENRSLREELRKLGDRVGASAIAPAAQVEERLDIVERRTEEQAQVKVEASQRFPIRVTGMALFNTFLNSKQNGGSDNPTIASLGRGNATGGAMWRQTVLGLEYQGPRTVWNGTVHGSLFVDFWGGSSQPLNLLPRVRTASISVDWGTRSLLVGQDKPIFSPREPNSLSQVGLSPLTGSGNLWLWEPQFRVEQRVRLGERAMLKLQGGVVQTTENSANVPPQYAPTLERFRPGLEGRFEFGADLGSKGRIEIAPGFHTSTTHVAGTSAPSNLYSIDWLVSPWQPLEFTGIFFSGKNLAHFGTGGIRQGFTVIGQGNVIPVHTKGGWGQVKIRATDRLSFHLMAGEHNDRDRDLLGAGIGRNQSFGGNFFYRLSPNVIFSFEAIQVRTDYLGRGTRLNNHYDLALAYLF